MRIIVDGRTREMRALWFQDRSLMMIDQRLLPLHFELVKASTCEEVAEAIRNMTVRGAPAIGAAAAYGMVLAKEQGMDIDRAASLLKSTRPTAFDLFFAVDQVRQGMEEGRDALQVAESYVQDIVDRCRKIGEHGAPLIRDGGRVMTHCNAGALATVDHGTALAPIRTAWRQGKGIFVFVSETRPRMQGMRLTAFELVNEGIPHAIISDGASGHFLREGVDLVIVGADRIAANGDFANKVGTFEKAVLAHELGIPFYTAAPLSTFDFDLPSGESIPIECRSGEEVTEIEGIRLAPEGSPALNPAFDVTPNKYVTGIITEVGILKPSEISRVRKAGKK